MKIKSLAINKVRFLRRSYFSITNQSRLKKKLSKVQERLPACFPIAIANFSIDYELFWCNAYENGSDMPEEKRVVNALRARENSVLFFSLLEELKMPCTWSVVAKLLAPELIPSKELQFAPSWAKENWYKKPGSDITAFEARELIKLLSAST